MMVKWCVLGLLAVILQTYLLAGFTAYPPQLLLIVVVAMSMQLPLHRALLIGAGGGLLLDVLGLGDFGVYTVGMCGAVGVIFALRRFGINSGQWPGMAVALMLGYGLLALILIAPLLWRLGVISGLGLLPPLGLQLMVTVVFAFVLKRPLQLKI